MMFRLPRPNAVRAPGVRLPLALAAIVAIASVFAALRLFRPIQSRLEGVRVPKTLRTLGHYSGGIFHTRINFRWLNVLVLTAVLAIAAIFTALNMFNFPQYEVDEGTYMGSAWSMFNEGGLSYYTYNYDHPPFGWWLIGVWSLLTGGFDTFGMSVNTGRVLMLLVTVLSTLLVYLIVRRVTSQTSAALLAAILFAVSPLGVPLHRQVFLDNIATLWLLASLYALAAAGGRLGRLMLSALAFGLAFWTKEVFIAFLPAMLLLVADRAHAVNRRFAVTLWGTTVGAAISFFLLLAFLKDELLPSGVLWSSSEPHVSLIDSYLFQASRPGGGGLLHLHSDFWAFIRRWAETDPILFLLGPAAVAIGLLAWRRDRFLFGTALLVVSFLLFLGRGGVVLYFYVIPLLALLAIAIGLLIGHFLNYTDRIAGSRWALVPALLLLTGLLVDHAAVANETAFTADQTASQEAAAEWIVDYVPEDSLIIMEAFPWVDLRDPAFTRGRTFQAHYYFPILRDPILRQQILNDDWREIDYLITSPQGAGNPDTRAGLPLLEEAYANSDVVATFESVDWQVEIRRVHKLDQVAVTDDPTLVRSWDSYKQDFVVDGRVVDPKTGGLTTSEGQAFAMLRAVYADDRETFDLIWSWTQRNLQVRDDALLSWRWGLRDDGTEGPLDSNSATDGDQDAALALLFAAKRWDNPDYQQAAVEIIEDIWDNETAVVAGRRYVVAGPWARGDGFDDFDQPIVNPSYLAPYAYRIFAEADPGRPWDELVHSSYDLLYAIAGEPAVGGYHGVVPNWVMLDPETAKPMPAPEGLFRAREFSFDASRVYWRLALDWAWFKDNRPNELITDFGLPRRELEEQGRLMAAYDLKGVPIVDYEATSMYAGVLPGLLISDNPELAHRFFAEKIEGAFHEDAAGAYWGEDPDDYYNQNMAWFATAFENGAMSNLWAGETEIDW